MPRKKIPAELAIFPVPWYNGGMSKSKQARFHAKSRETVLKKGMMDFSVTGEYKHFVAGDAVLTDERFHFDADLGTGEALSFDIPLQSIGCVRKVGVPFFTQSMLISADERDYRLNAVFVGRWVKAVERARAAARAE